MDLQRFRSLLGILEATSEQPEVSVTQTSAAVEDEVLWQGGDLRLVVGRFTAGKTIRFLVSSHVLQMVSPVWAAMLNRENKWAENSMKEIEFPDDNALAMRTILHRAHFFDLPRLSDLEGLTLYELAVACDKYGTFKLMRLTISAGLAKMKCSKEHAPSDMERLFIYWTFRFRKYFIEAAELIISEWHSNSEGQLVDMSGAELTLQTPLPTRVFESMSNLRLTAITEIVDILMTKVEAYEKGHVCTADKDYEKSYCDALAYGSFVMGVRQILPELRRDVANTITLSLDELCDEIEKKLRSKSLRFFGGEVHKDCAENSILEKVRHAVKKQKDRVQRLHFEYFTAQV